MWKKANAGTAPHAAVSSAFFVINQFTTASSTLEGLKPLGSNPPRESKNQRMSTGVSPTLSTEG